MAEAGVEPARRRPVSVGPSSPTRPPSPRRHSAAAATTVAGSPPLPPAAAGEDAADDFWRRRCLELSHSLQLCRAADESACLLLRHQTASLQQQMADSERKAQRAERKVRLLDHRLREVGWTSGESEEQLEALRCAVQEKDAVIGQLKCQVEEQRLLKIDETRQVEMKAAKIKEWVTGKLRDDKPLPSGENSTTSASCGATSPATEPAVVESRPAPLPPVAPPRGRAANDRHDYSDIFSPSDDWGSRLAAEADASEPPPPTPPLHRLPSWEEHIYQVAQQSMSSPSSLPSRGDELDEPVPDTPSDLPNIAVPVYSTIGGRASLIRTGPLTGDSSDSSQDEANEPGAAGARRSLHSRAASEGDPAGPSARHGRSGLRSELSLDRLAADWSQPAYKEPPDETATPDAGSPRKARAFERAGYLSKLGGKLKTWRKKWFVLSEDALKYWKSQHEAGRRSPQSQFRLDDRCRLVRQDGAHTFELASGKRVLYLTAENVSVVDDWVRTLQAVLRRTSTRLLLGRGLASASVQGWLTRVKHGHARRYWCALVGRRILYFRKQTESVACSQTSVRDCCVEEVSQTSDTEDDSDAPARSAHLTIGLFPADRSPTYLVMASRADRDAWLYPLTVAAGGGGPAGTPFERLLVQLMEADGDPESPLWRHTLLLHAREPPQQPLTSLPEAVHSEAAKLFKSCQLFASVPVSSSGIDYHVALAQNTLRACCERHELHDELLALLAKQTCPHVSHKHGVQGRLLTATQSLFARESAGGAEPLQSWQLLALAVSLSAPRRGPLLWYLRLHLRRHADTQSETGKYAAFCQRALERSLEMGGREVRPSRMEVLSILLRNPYHHSLPHAIPVHFLSNTYQVVGFDGSTTVAEFVQTLNAEIGCRDVGQSGFALFSDDPLRPERHHLLQPDSKLCDVISRWETSLRERGSGRFETTRVIRLSYRCRLYRRAAAAGRTDRERLLLAHQAAGQVAAGLFPLTGPLALQLAALMAQIEYGDYGASRGKGTGSDSMDHHQVEKCLERFFPQRYWNSATSEEKSQFREDLADRWTALKGRSAQDCVRVYLACCSQWSHFGSALFKVKVVSDETTVYLCVGEDCIAVLNIETLRETARYPYTTVVTFGGCQEDFLLAVTSSDGDDRISTETLLFHMSKPKILEVTRLMADYMNEAGRQGGPARPSGRSGAGSSLASLGSRSPTGRAEQLDPEAIRREAA